MPADVTLSGIGGLSLAVKLNERAHQEGILFRGVAIIALEQGSRLGRHVGAAGRQIRIQRIAEILRTLFTVSEVRDTLDVATTAMTRGDCTKRTVSFADRVKSLPQSATVRTRRVHGKIAGIFGDACGHLLQIKRARSLQDHLADLPLAFPTLPPPPRRNFGRF